MMKVIYVLVLVALLAGGYYWYNAQMISEVGMESDGETKTMNTEEERSMESDDTMDGEMDSESDNMMEAEASVDVSGTVGEARNFSVDAFNYGYSVDEIVVNEGDTVTITMTSTDGFHDWVVDEFNAAAARVTTGNTSQVEFIADKKGTYEYYCSVGNHRQLGMVGTLVVE